MEGEENGLVFEGWSVRSWEGVVRDSIALRFLGVSRVGSGARFAGRGREDSSGSAFRSGRDCVLGLDGGTLPDIKSCRRL